MNAEATSRRRASRIALPVLLVALLSIAGGAAAQPHGTAGPAADPRVGLRAGIEDAGTAALHLELVAHVPRPEGFFNPADPGDFSFMNADMAFRGTTLFLGGFQGLQVWDISDPSRPTLRATLACPGGQGDVSVHGDLLFVSVEETRGRVDCGPQGVAEPVSAERFRGVRVFDITDVERPRQVAAVQTCRGSHTHTLVPDPADPSHVYIYVSGTSGVRPGEELAGCSGGPPEDDPASALFRIEMIRVPLAHPERAAVVGTPRFLLGLTAPPEHGPSPQDVAAGAVEAAAARARGEFTVTVQGVEQVVPPPFARQMLDDIVRERGGNGEPTAADSAALRAALPSIAAQMVGDGPSEGPRPGPNQCHDITVYPEAGLAGGACAGYGLLLDIRDPANPVRIAAAADSNFAYWHSATFSNDGRKVVFTDEWGGGLAPRCRATDRPEWGANAIFTVGEDRALEFQGYYKLPAAQTAQENCVAHNGSLVPVPGRDVMAQAWYQGGVSVFDFSDPRRPVEIAFFDRGPMDAERMLMAGYWSVYWYNGHLYASEIGRGLDVFRLTPSEHLSANELAAAEAVRADVLNAQHQTRVAWPASFAVARAYLDQLVRSEGIAAERAARVTAELDRAEELGAGRDAAQLAETARLLEADARAATASDPDRLRLLAATLQELSAPAP